MNANTVMTRRHAAMLHPTAISDARRCLTIVATVCLFLQLVSAGLFSRDLQTPNSATQIAQSLVQHGRFAVDSWHRLRGPDGVVPDRPLVAFQLPSEPLYLALGFLVLPEPLWRYLHVPVTVVLVIAIAAVAFFVGGPSLALCAGLVAAADPFIFFHGPVWDDTFLGAAAEWVVFAVFAAILSVERADPGTSGGRHNRLLILMAVCAAVGAGARLQSQVVLAGIALVAIASTSLRPVRKLGWAVLIGVVVSIGAWGLRNAVVLNAFMIGTSHDGLTLFESNYPDARASVLQTGTAEGLSQTHLATEFARTATLGEVAADRQLKQDAWRYIASHPLDVTKTALLKLAVSLSGVNFALPFASARNVVAIVSNVTIMVLGMYGLWAGWRRSQKSAVEWFSFSVFVLMISATLGMLVLGPVGLRYRISLTGFFYIGVGLALVRVVDRAWRTDWRSPAADPRAV